MGAGGLGELGLDAEGLEPLLFANLVVEVEYALLVGLELYAPAVAGLYGAAASYLLLALLFGLVLIALEVAGCPFRWVLLLHRRLLGLTAAAYGLVAVFQISGQGVVVHPDQMPFVK